MNFNFIPYILNQKITDFKDQISYVETDNGVDLYKALNDPEIRLLGLPVKSIHLYFYGDKLITIYLHLMENPDNIDQVLKILLEGIGRVGKALTSHMETIFWDEKDEILALKNDKKEKRLTLYYSLKAYSVIKSE